MRAGYRTWGRWGYFFCRRQNVVFGCLSAYANETNFPDPADWGVPVVPGGRFAFGLGVAFGLGFDLVDLRLRRAIRLPPCRGGS